MNMEQYNFNNVSNMHVIKIKKEEIDKIDFSIGNEPRETLSNFFRRQERKPDILTNAGYFNMKTGDSVFNYKDENKIYSSYKTHQWGMGITNKGDLRYGSINDPDFKDFVSGFPIYLDGGKKVDISYAKEVDYLARRTLLGYNNEYIFIVLIENPGAHLDLCQSIMFELGCIYAINLDGGGSTKALNKKGESITTDPTNRPVDNFLCIYLKDKNNEDINSKTLIYRIQVGAFKNYENAQKFLKNLQMKKSNIGIDYSKAYIRKINDLYKIQVGAFKNKDNALLIVNELKQYNYNAYLTTK